MDPDTYQGAVKQQMLKTINAYQNADGTVDLDGWLADTALALGLDPAPQQWRAWAYEVIGAVELERDQCDRLGRPWAWYDLPPYAKPLGDCTCHVKGCTNPVQVRCGGCRAPCCQAHNQVTHPFALGGTAICASCYGQVFNGVTRPRLQAALDRKDNRNWPADQQAVLPF